MLRKSQRKSARLRPKSKARAQKRHVAKRRFQDGQGRFFDEITHAMLWPVVHRLDSIENLDEYRFNSQCFYCERHFVVGLDPHHIVGGSAGRCDCKANLMSLCRACHEKIQSNAALLPKLLYQKWKHDRWNTDWRRLCELRGRVFGFDLTGGTDGNC